MKSLFIILFTLFYSTIHTLASKQEANSLLKWKASLINQHNPLLSSWSLHPAYNLTDTNRITATAPCTWYGVHCNRHSDVIKLNLSNSKLDGTLQKFTFSSLTNLTHLDLKQNNISGPIPVEIQYFTKLVFLDLSRNLLSGKIPQEIGNMNKLIIIRLAHNLLMGPVPGSLGNLSRLETLDVHENVLSGVVPQELGKLEFLTRLSLSHNELTGRIPVSVGNLTKLELLYLNDNRFNNSIPEELGNLKSLVSMLLLVNGLTGPIPDSVGKLRNLEQFVLHDNELPGYFPESVTNCKRLRYLTLGNNSLTGPVPESVCKLRSLEILDLGTNRFTGPIPQCVSHFSPKLQVLDLRLNRFNGSIPATFLKQNNDLRRINMNGNQLKGFIPRSLINCRNLEVLDLGNNILTGGFPHWIDTVPKMQVLVLRGNKLNGPLHASNTKSPFPKLRILDLSSNGFMGRLPVNYFKNFKEMMSGNRSASGDLYMGRHFMYNDRLKLVVKGLHLELQRISVINMIINLSANKFQGEIPDTIGQLTSLRSLNLSHNRLIGEIPTQMRNLTLLESLDLSSNKMTGKIPLQLTSLTSLAVVNFSHNQFHGAIPKGGQFNTFGNDSYQGNSGLCGFPLITGCGDEDRSSSPTLEEDEDSSFFKGLSWESVVMGYGFGMFIGSGIGWVMLYFGSPKWVVRITERKQVRHQRKPRKDHGIARQANHRAWGSQVFDANSFI
ncbi:uncharacterized protein LOC143556492 [Bidens hawaiensis]|uniref:uncharacterized protein LOC143556492 n=1 Tax=Bidens hawaiensis TaxID=980011 RepID=UPI00404A2D6A